ncbi:MAG: hypothetical protein V4736_04750 [Bdellovibrionota bacterium]
MSEPLANDSYSALPVGSTISILKPLNLPPGYNSIFLRSGERVPLFQNVCELVFHSTSANDRLIMPRTMVVTDIKLLQDAEYSQLIMNNVNPGHIIALVKFEITVKDSAVKKVSCGFTSLPSTMGTLRYMIEEAGLQLNETQPKEVY